MLAADGVLQLLPEDLVPEGICDDVKTCIAIGERGADIEGGLLEGEAEAHPLIINLSCKL